MSDNPAEPDLAALVADIMRIEVVHPVQEAANAAMQRLADALTDATTAHEKMQAAKGTKRRQAEKRHAASLARVDKLQREFTVAALALQATTAGALNAAWERAELLRAKSVQVIEAAERSIAYGRNGLVLAEQLQAYIAANGGGPTTH